VAGTAAGGKKPCLTEFGKIIGQPRVETSWGKIDGNFYLRAAKKTTLTKGGLGGRDDVRRTPQKKTWGGL